MTLSFLRAGCEVVTIKSTASNNSKEGIKEEWSSITHLAGWIPQILEHKWKMILNNFHIHVIVISDQMCFRVARETLTGTQDVDRTQHGYRGTTNP